MIPYSRQSISAADVRAVAGVLRSSRLTQGPAIERFENAIAKKTGARHVVAFSSGTAALHAAYFAAGIGKGDEVIVPALTFAATANAALYLGAKPVFADIDINTGLMDPHDTAQKITKKTKAIVPVDYAGRPAEMRSFRAIAKRHKLVLIEDGAQSLGATYGGKPLGTEADMTMFSFHPVKSITTGEGGVIVTNNKEYARLLRLFRHHGISKDVSTFKRKGLGAWYQEMQLLGYNYRITDIQAALGVSQMKRLDRFIAKRRSAAKRYDNLLMTTRGLILPPADDRICTSAWHLYPVRLAPEIAYRRDDVLSILHKKGIGAQVHYLPVYRHVFYEELGYRKGICPNAEEFSASEISLPLFPDITIQQQKYVAEAVIKALMRISRA